MNLRTLSAITLKLVAGVLVCAGASVAISAFGLCLLTLPKPRGVEELIFPYPHVFTEVAGAWGLAVGIVFFFVALALMPGLRRDGPMARRLPALLGAAWMCAVFTAAWFSSFNSFQFVVDHWEVESRGRAWHRVTESEARKLMWLNVRGTSALIVAEASSVLIAGMCLWGLSSDLSQRWRSAVPSES